METNFDEDVWAGQYQSITYTVTAIGSWIFATLRRSQFTRRATNRLSSIIFQACLFLPLLPLPSLFTLPVVSLRSSRHPDSSVTEPVLLIRVCLRLFGLGLQSRAVVARYDHELRTSFSAGRASGLSTERPAPSPCRPHPDMQRG